ncbi:mRNA 3'-end-processing protein rna14 [Quaeritorhiza haematococci]|nr:mRNA 3'-end-processing protein rna14 [Quaeritorhiza haematococci]
MTARTALRELKNLLEAIEKAQRTWLAKPPTWTEKECQILYAWKRYIAWERSNPLHLDDKAMLMARVLYTYKSALLMLRFYPEIWYEAATYLIENGKTEDAIVLLRSGVETIPTSLLLNFTLAELEESRQKDFKDLSTIYETLIRSLEERITSINAKYDEERERFLQQTTSSGSTPAAAGGAGGAASVPSSSSSSSISSPLLGGVGAGAAGGAGGKDEDWDGEARERQRERMKEREKELEIKVEEKRRKEIGEVRKALTMAYVVFMRVARRQGEKQGRMVFGLARKSPHVTWQIYVASAMMEFHCSKDATVTGRVFEHSMKMFTNEPNQLARVVEGYLEFLIGSNNDANAMAVFERAITSIPPQHCRRLWDLFLDYTSNYGALGVITKLQKRREEMYPEDAGQLDGLRALAQKYSYMDITTVADQELGLKALADYELKAPKPKNLPGAPHVPGSPGRRGDDRSGRDGERGRKFQNLEPVHPERYPKPDFSKWTTFRPESAVSHIRKGSTVSDGIEGPVGDKGERDHDWERDRERGGPMGRGVGQSAGGNMSPHLGAGVPLIPQDQGASMAPPTLMPGGGPSVLGRSTPPPVAPLGTPQALAAVPPAVAQLMVKLSGAQKWDGPIVNVAELLEVIRNLPIGLPSAPINWVPTPPMEQQSSHHQQQPHHRGGPQGRIGFDRGGGADRDHRQGPPQRPFSAEERRSNRPYHGPYDRDRGPPRGRGRGRFMGGGGPPGGMKRKGLRDYGGSDDEDYDYGGGGGERENFKCPSPFVSSSGKVGSRVFWFFADSVLSALMRGHLAYLIGWRSQMGGDHDMYRNRQQQKRFRDNGMDI